MVTLNDYLPVSREPHKIIQNHIDNRSIASGRHSVNEELVAYVMLIEYDAVSAMETRNARLRRKQDSSYTTVQYRFST